MKTSLRWIRLVSLFACAVSLAAVGCSKKSDAPATPETAPGTSAPAAPTAPQAPATQTSVPTANPAAATAAATDAAKQRMGDVDAAMKDAASSASGVTDALQTQAKQMLTQYSGELASLQAGVAKVKALIDQNSAMLPAGVASKYQELNALLPKLTTMVDSLKNYQNADIANLLPKLKTDFATAQKLYAEIKAAIPGAA